jgi:hypothetical protein
MKDWIHFSQSLDALKVSRAVLISRFLRKLSISSDGDIAGAGSDAAGAGACGGGTLSIPRATRTVQSRT